VPACLRPPKLDVRPLTNSLPMSAPDLHIHGRHARVLDAQLDALGREPDVIAALLQGSVARGDAHPGSDLDLLVVLADDRPSVFRHARVDGVRVEQHRVDVSGLYAKLHQRPGLPTG
jgi:predicted nucleotidyltransferase